jgi:hypothetical protein
MSSESKVSSKLSESKKSKSIMSSESKKSKSIMSSKVSSKFFLFRKENGENITNNNPHPELIFYIVKAENKDSVLNKVLKDSDFAFEFLEPYINKDYREVRFDMLELKLQFGKIKCNGDSDNEEIFSKCLKYLKNEEKENFNERIFKTVYNNYGHCFIGEFEIKAEITKGLKFLKKCVDNRVEIRECL